LREKRELAAGGSRLHWLARAAVLASVSLFPAWAVAQDVFAAPNVPQDGKIASLLARAQKGRAQDEVKLGVALQFGQGVTADPSEAARWFLKAANQGDPAGQTRIGYLYLAGYGVPRDEGEAFRWLQRAAVEDYAPAQAGLGYLLLSGLGVKQDTERG